MIVFFYINYHGLPSWGRLSFKTEVGGVGVGQFLNKSTPKLKFKFLNNIEVLAGRGAYGIISILPAFGLPYTINLPKD